MQLTCFWPCGQSSQTKCWSKWPAVASYLHRGYPMSSSAWSCDSALRLCLQVYLWMANLTQNASCGSLWLENMQERKAKRQHSILFVNTRQTYHFLLVGSFLNCLFLSFFLFPQTMKKKNKVACNRT